MATKQERPDPIEVDINDPSLLEGIESELDSTEDWQANAPPPPGRISADKPKLYRFRLFIEDETFEQGQKQGFKKGDPNGVYYKKTLTCKLQDPSGEWQDAVCFYNVSTGLGRGKKLSSMAGILAMLRVKVPAKATDLSIARLLKNAMNKLDGPILIGDCDWSSWDVDGKGDFGSALKVGMYNFPKKADGSYNHIVQNKAGKECPAKLKINKFFANQVKEATNGQVKPVATTMIPPKPKVEEVVSMGGGVVLNNEGEVDLDFS